MSDLHLEFGPPPGDLVIPDADICICAGDIFDGGVARSIDWLGENITPSMPVIFVPGNHEYFGSSIKEGLAAGYEAAERYEHLFLLNGDVVLFDDFRFVGATMWANFDLFGQVHSRLAMETAKEQLNDYRRIKLSKVPFAKFSPRDSRHLHLMSWLDIERVLCTPSICATIVVTHHAPSILSVAHGFLRDPLTPSFASSLEAKILEYQPSLWVHGHLHNSSDYIIGKTRVVCNPRGYPSEPTADFNPALVIDLEEVRNG